LGTQLGGQRRRAPSTSGAFYVAFPLANPHATPIPAADRGGSVRALWEHEDFRPPIPGIFEITARRKDFPEESGWKVEIAMARRISR
jgi:hypothetical protein